MTTFQKLSDDEINARIDMAKEVNKTFPFLMNHYRIRSQIGTDKSGLEVGSLVLEIYSTMQDGSERAIELLLSKYLEDIVNNDMKKEFDKLTKALNKAKAKVIKLETQLTKLKKKNEKSIQSRKRDPKSKGLRKGNSNSIQKR